ncbi:MAG: hypothetical protein HRT47_13885 [Candidatus Caenarcaniphilales bacterium]|nr:hypothetical protein [Candidatus Caenarcaniphilales bacterium]
MNSSLSASKSIVLTPTSQNSPSTETLKGSSPEEKIKAEQATLANAFFNNKLHEVDYETLSKRIQALRTQINFEYQDPETGKVRKILDDALDSSKKHLLILDIDGTLNHENISCESHEKVNIPKETLTTLSELSKLKNFKVVFLTSRSNQDLRQIFNEKLSEGNQIKAYTNDGRTYIESGRIEKNLIDESKEPHENYQNKANSMNDKLTKLLEKLNLKNMRTEVVPVEPWL